MTQWCGYFPRAGMRSLSAVLGFDVLDTLFEKWVHLSRLTASKEILEVLGDQGFIDYEEGSSCWPRENEHERPWWPAACVGLVGVVRLLLELQKFRRNSHLWRPVDAA